MKNSAPESSQHLRPVVYDYGVPVDFLRALLKYHKSHGAFSLRQRTAKVGACSQALVSQILNGKRQLNRENFPVLASVFKLTPTEQEFLDRKLSAHFYKMDLTEEKPTKLRQPQNHLLSEWLYPYVKDLVNLKGFAPQPDVLFSMLNGLVPPPKIKKAIEFLIKEGFWRNNGSGQIIPENSAVTTTNEIPNEKIRSFHKKALEVAIRGIQTLPAHQRKSSTVLISVDEEKIDELKSLIDSFQQQLLQFIEKNPTGQKALVQVAIHLTPVGKSHE